LRIHSRLPHRGFNGANRWIRNLEDFDRLQKTARTMS
jgi:hypothetical protein